MEDRKDKGNTFTEPDMRENSAEVEPKEDVTRWGWYLRFMVNLSQVFSSRNYKASGLTDFTLLLSSLIQPDLTSGIQVLDKAKPGKSCQGNHSYWKAIELLGEY